MKTKPKRSDCTVPDCGRPAYVRRMCRTHHRQMLTTGETKPIRPYRTREPDTVKFSGLRLTKRCAELLGRHARKKELSHGAAIADVLEEWHARNPPGEEP